MSKNFKFEITSVKKQNSLYYSVFFNRWTDCPCNSVFDSVVILSDTELTMDTEGLKDLVRTEVQKRK